LTDPGEKVGGKIGGQSHHPPVSVESCPGIKGKGKGAERIQDLVREG